MKREVIIKMHSLYWRITNQCNLQCRHCCYKCGPNGKSVSVKNAKKIIDNFPKEIKAIEITGGEPMIVRPLLEEVLGYIQSKKLKDLKVMLQTNGFWVKDEETTYKHLVWLSDLGVRELDFTSDDIYHREQGLDSYRLNSSPLKGIFGRAFRRLSYEYGDQAINEFSLRGAGAIDPFGRGKKMPQDKLYHRSCFVSGYLDKNSEHFTIDPSGEVYPCCYQMPYSIGNVIKTPLSQIAENARRDHVLRALHKGGLRKVAENLGVDGECSCYSCEELFSKLNEMEVREANIPEHAGVAV